MSGAEELNQLIDMITVNPAQALGLPGYGLADGAPANLVVFDAPTGMDALRLLPRRRMVIRRGAVVARTEPARTTVVWDGRDEPVDFMR